MLENRDHVFGEAFMSAFPDHGWGDDGGNQDKSLADLDDEEEMAMQMEQDAILTCYLVLESHQPSQHGRFISVAKTVNYSR